MDILTRTRLMRSFVGVLALWGFATLVMFAVAGCGASDSSKPTVIAPADETVECDGNGNQAALDAWLNRATFTEGCGGATLSSDVQGFVQGCGATGSVTVIWTVTDLCGSSESQSASFTIVDSTAPTLAVPQPISVTCGEPSSGVALAGWVASATAADACSDATITTRRLATPGNCTATITWTATDGCGNSISMSSLYTTTGDTTPPVITLNGSAAITVECGSEWQDADVTVTDDCDALIQPTVTGEVNLHLPGVYVLTYTAVDACGNAGASFPRTVTVVDTTPPVVDVAAPIELWPPNHQMETFTLADLATVTDACEGVLNANDAGTIIDIYSDEPDNGTGDGNTIGDIVIVDDHTFSVRAERKGNGNGRVYGIRFVVSDSSGNSVEATAFVYVPHDQSGGDVVDDGAGSGHTVVR